MSAPTLINLPPPPSDPGTPSEMGPGTPNSTTTSLSALSTTAIKDGHTGNAPPHVSSRHTHNTLAAERADRISRLAGLERVSAGRTHSTSSIGGAGPGSVAPSQQQPGYFDVQMQPRERSTVGSASATGSVGGRTTWASSSDLYDADKMSEDLDDGVSSIGGFSEEGNASLVGFGEGANSTVSGPISSRGPGGKQSGMNSPVVGKMSAIPPYMQPGSSSAMTPERRGDTRSIDGMTYDSDSGDMVARNAQQQSNYARNASQTGTETAERIMRERLDEGESQAAKALGSPEEQQDGPKGLGKFYFEER